MARAKETHVLPGALGVMVRFRYELAYVVVLRVGSSISQD